ncbi:urea transporter [Mucilaginibacter ginsenosidivorax]|uniref:Peptidoglycan DD-metalloendopeptidase family protein n=1 Tax=Mucilaginibacter ginsenosidivorax TaxID=862126 RepID=A0A5B8W786_9SPHI|nr:urea transporter [Mucilaginibacter ginsenosidivorax]QEC79880.1 peptidoglycan DD-metalloendopeptidase family protein [Mucilaginibacter ginsenosidivorax]
MKQTTAFIKSVVSSYSVLFFSQNRILGAILLLVSFFNPVSGFAGLGCVVFSLIVCRLLKFDADNQQLGIYSFNSLLLGIAFGAFYSVNVMFLLWLFVACCAVIVATIIISTRLGTLGLPMLSLPFVLVFWLVLLASNSIFAMGLQQKDSYLLEEIYAGPGNHLAGIEGYLAMELPQFVSLFFRSLSAVLFQHNIIAGMLISIGMLIHSRIAFSLLIISFISAIGINGLTHIYPEGISYYHLGANFMMAAVAIGSFFTIPSFRSYLLAILSIPMGFLIINGLTGFMSVHALPVFSLPFCIVNISLLYFLKLRHAKSKLQLVVFQHYSPERNLYQFLNQEDRLNDLKYYKLNLPFMGYWTVSQGYDGNITHKGDWGQALDFVISDDEHNTFQYPGTLPEHFYCFNKPVLACAAGVVEQVVNNIEDNAIGKQNLKENWGNTVVIRHAADFYSKVSHLKKNSIKVKPGDVVKSGDLLGLCGNSGRSPEPHLHFQLQATPYIGSRTLSYPISYYIGRVENKNSFISHTIPTEGNLIGNPEIDTQIKKAFDFQPGYIARLVSENGTIEDWEVFKDALGQSYIYSKTTGAVAYFINNGVMFYFTSFYGDKKSILYNFYLAAYKVIFNNAEAMPITDKLPLNETANKLLLWIQDVIAPFYGFINIKYNSDIQVNKNGISIISKIHTEIAGKKNGIIEGSVYVDYGNLVSFSINTNGKNITAKWGTKN